MADISKIQLGNETYNIKDEKARQEISAISNKIDSNVINLQNLLFYDDTSIKPQGMCVDYNNLAYIYSESNFPYGEIYIFNIQTNKYVNKISNIKFYHGNDMTYLNNKLYVASTKNLQGALANKIICVYDLINNTTKEINPFINETDYQDLWRSIKL